MRKLTIFSAVLSLFLLVPASITWAQNITLTGVVYENSMVKIPFSTPQGDIKVYLPDNLNAGSQVKGKVVIEAKGKNQKQINSNLYFLQSLSIIPSVSNTGPIITEPFKIVLDEATKKAVSDFVFTIPENADATRPLEFKLTPADEKSPDLLKAEVRFFLDVVASEGLPSPDIKRFNPYLNAVLKKVITGNESLVIEPGIDSRMAKNTGQGKEVPEVVMKQVKDEESITGNQPVTSSGHILVPWVSSPRQIIVILPPSITGACDVFIKFKDGRLFFADRIYVARLKTNIAKNNLQKDETTSLSVAAEGLEMCPWPTQLEIENTSGSTVVLERGNRQVYDLPAAPRILHGEMPQEKPSAPIVQNVIGIKPGDFTININLHLPETAFKNSFEWQLKVLNTADEYNGWVNAVKNDIRSFALMQPGTDDGKRLRSLINQFADGITQLPGPEKLAESKIQLITYLKQLDVPQTFFDNARCTYQAYKAACHSVNNFVSGMPQPIYWDAIRNGLHFIQQKTKSSELKNSTEETKEIISRFQNGTEAKEKLAGLNEKLKEINQLSDKRDTNVHIEFGIDKTEYLPPGYTHVKTGPEKTIYFPEPMKHIDTGRNESWYVSESYVHVDTGWDKTNYVSPTVMHASEDGPQKSNYILKDEVHWKSGPNKSYYLNKNIQHIDTGMHKSKMQYWLPGVDKPIREWEFEQKKNSKRKSDLLQQFFYAGNKIPAKIPDKLFFSNEMFIRNLYNGNSKNSYEKSISRADEALDEKNAKEVLIFVLNQLPGEVTIYPSENYYYFLFSNKGKLFKGSLSLFAHNRDEGIIDIGYIEVNENRWLYSGTAPNGGSGAFSSADGFRLEKINDFSYSLFYNERKIIFNLHQPGLAPPVKAKLTGDETFAGPSFDESGLQFHLIYNSATQHLCWLLNEDTVVQENFILFSDNILIGNRTGFAFYNDKNNNRKILIGVKGENVLQNNWYDGPFDQMPDNYVYSGQLEVKKYLELSYPGTRGRIDNYGHYLDNKGTRIAVAPYLVYFSKEELKNLVNECEQEFAELAEKCHCLTRQKYELPAGYFK